MKLEQKFKSIGFRWVINIFLPVLIIVAVVTVAVSIIYSSLCVERVRALCEDYTNDFSFLESATPETFENMAFDLIENYQYKSKLEVQILDSEGRPVASTTAFSDTDADIPDYKTAISTNKNTAVFRGENSSGEKILACTNLVFDINGNRIGAYRWITSMEKANTQITQVVLLVIGMGMLVIIFSAVSGAFFIKSILRPIKDAGNTARKIALGDFQSRIEIKNHDEIGELCNSINYMATELRQAETMKNDFISSVSHELRTPLTAIRGWGETAKMSVGTDEELVNRGLEVVLSEAERLGNLVEELLDFSRMQSGRLTVNTRPINLSELLSLTADMYTELARQQGIELSYARPLETATVMGDPDRLKQVFVNVIDNAVKYTEKGGLVLITQSIEEACVRILVKDTGVGIPAQDIDKVKEKFFKSNKTIRGSGIGLAVADEIIKQHQGLLFLESTEGVGTTVTIVLPLYEEEAVIEEETVLLEELTQVTELPEEETLDTTTDTEENS
ncbi:MAG: HAMP domain-containing sensor histidine kinase [Oscillospiraceae bacterium]|nr:HAMP domain-containing sensor histidine kinase [Oscillospiraceae bacterium]